MKAPEMMIPMVTKAPYPHDSDLTIDLVNLRDAIVQSVYDNSASPEIRPITQWVEASGGDNLLDRFLDTAVNYESIRSGELLTEDALREYFWLEGDERVTDEDRVEFTRGILESCVEPGNHLQKAIQSYRLADSLGHKAFLGCVISGSGFDNSLDFAWSGPFASEDSFLNALEDMGYITARSLDDLTHTELLGLFVNCGTN